MKEAAGEANLTVITIILIGVVVAVAIPLVNNLLGNARERACCTEAGAVWEDGSCSVDVKNTPCMTGKDNQAETE